MTRLAICGKPLRLYEWPGGPVVLEPPPCARPAGHKGTRHRSAAALAAARQRATGQDPTGSPVVAAAIRRAREDAGLSRYRLAVLAGVTGACVEHWEAGRRAPGPGSLAILEVLFGRSFTAGAVIRDARLRAGLSQRGLAAAVGVAQGCVWFWEHDRRAPAPESWIQMELTLGPLGIVRDPGPEAQEQQRGEAHEHAA